MEVEAPRELVVDAKPPPGDSSDGGGVGMGQLVAPVIVAALLAKFVSGTAALAALGAGIALLVLRRKPREGRFVLRVDGDGLEIRRERGARPPVRIALVDLVDVTMNRATTQASGAAAKERVWIALERRASDEPIFLPEERLTPLEAQEWHAKTRAFLRKHGWLPEDERAGGDDAG